MLFFFLLQLCHPLNSRSKAQKSVGFSYQKVVLYERHRAAVTLVLTAQRRDLWACVDKTLRGRVMKLAIIALTLLTAATVLVGGCMQPHQLSSVNNTATTTSAKPSATPITATPTQPQKYNYHVSIYAQCVPAGCLMTESYVWGSYYPHYKDNPRVTFDGVEIKHCGPVYNAANCAPNDVFVRVTVQETGQVVYFYGNDRDNVIPFVDSVLAA